MEAHISTSLDNLQLGNLNHKLKTMRDKLRNDIAQDMQYMHYKMGLNGEQDSNPSDHQHSPATPSIQNDQDVNDEFFNTAPHRSPLDPATGYPDPSQQPQYFINLEIAEKPIDLQEIRRLSKKKISEGHWDEYIKCSLNGEVVEKAKELFEQMEDEGSKVSTRELVQRIGKLGVKFSEAVAVQVPIIKRAINLKKVLFELYFKAKQLPERTSWKQFKEAIQDYRFLPEPSIDVYMTSEGQKAKNYYNLPPEVVNELKNIYLRSSKEMFLSYCPLSSLLAKLERSKVIQQNMHCLVRPKSNYEVEVPLKDTIHYITSYAPQFVDQDQFLLFFTVKGFTYYPIQQRKAANIGSTLSSQQSKHIKRVKSDRIIPKNIKKKNPHFDEYFLSTNNPHSIRNKKLKQMLNDESTKKETQSKSFKARPISKSISKDKYQQFVNGMQHKLEQGRKTLQELRSQSQRELQRLKSETKLFKPPKKHEIEQHYYQITARPPPQSIKSPKLKQIQNQKATRRNKILSQTQLKYQHSWKELPFVATLDLSPKHQQTQEKEHYRIKVKDIPDYRAEQLRIEEQLQQRKHHFHPTQPSPFYLHTDARHENHRANHSPPSPEPIQHYDYKQIIYSQEPEIYYTQKFADLVVANKKKAQEKEKKLSQQLQEDIERQKRHENFARFMKSNLMKLPDTAKICENEAKMKIERHKKYWKNLDREHQNNLNQVYAKILKRPFLYQLQSTRAPLQEKAAVDGGKKSKKAKRAERKAINKSL